MGNNSERPWKDEDHNKDARNSLVGKKITEARYLTEEEAEQNGWDKRPLVIFFNDDTYLIPQSDDEGNSGGALNLISINGDKDKENFFGNI